MSVERDAVATLQVYYPTGTPDELLAISSHALKRARTRSVLPPEVQAMTAHDREGWLQQTWCYAKRYLIKLLDDGTEIWFVAIKDSRMITEFIVRRDTLGQPTLITLYGVPLGRYLRIQKDYKAGKLPRRETAHIDGDAITPV